MLSLNLQGDANRSYSDDDRSSSNFDESEKHDSIKLSGEPHEHIFIHTDVSQSDTPSEITCSRLRPVALETSWKVEKITLRQPKRVMQNVFLQTRGSAR